MPAPRQVAKWRFPTKVKPLKKSFDVRAVDARDLPALRTIIDATGLFPSEMLDGMIAGYLDQTRPDIWFTCTIEDQPVGFGYCEPERMTVGTWNLLAIGVLPERQGQGAGAALLRYLEAALTAKSARASCRNGRYPGLRRNT